MDVHVKHSIQGGMNDRVKAMCRRRGVIRQTRMVIVSQKRP
jgi:hypothetical protein